MAVTSISSFLITKVFDWENSFENKEQNATNPSLSRQNYLGCAKVVLVRFSIITFAILSKIEMVAYSLMSVLSLFFYPYTDKPYTFFISLKKNCSTLNNLHGKVFLIIESLNPTPFSLLSFDSFNCYIKALKESSANVAHPFIGENRELGVDDKLKLEESKKDSTERATSYILNDVLNDIPTQQKQAVQEWDEEILLPFLVKSIFIYAKGDKCRDEIPDFFRPITKKSIEFLRILLAKDIIPENLLNMINSLESYVSNSEEKKPSEIIKCLNDAAYLEYEGGSFFATFCLGSSIKKMKTIK